MALGPMHWVPRVSRAIQGLAASQAWACRATAVFQALAAYQDSVAFLGIAASQAFLAHQEPVDFLALQELLGFLDSVVYRDFLASLGLVVSLAFQGLAFLAIQAQAFQDSQVLVVIQDSVASQDSQAFQDSVALVAFRA